MASMGAGVRKPKRLGATALADRAFPRAIFRIKSGEAGQKLFALRKPSLSGCRFSGRAGCSINPF
jgi:hypothetical protein